MGWSWGLYFCHEAFSECCGHAMRATQADAVLLADGQPPPSMSSSSGFCAPYVDNGNIIAGPKPVAARLLGGQL